MKYDIRFSEDQNTERWQGEAEDRDPPCAFGELPPDVQAVALRVNAVLARLETEACREAAPWMAELRARTVSPDASLADFDIILSLRLGLRADDAEWERGDANLLCIYGYSLRAAHHRRLVEGIVPLADAGHWAGWPDAAPCRSFCLLMTEIGIAWSDLPRIASVARRLTVRLDSPAGPL